MNGYQFCRELTADAKLRDIPVILMSAKGDQVGERFLTLHLHELLAFLGQRGVTTLLLMTQHGVVGGEIQVPVDASYLADTVILLRYFEALGEVRQAISVIKKRTGRHERTIRELRFGRGIEIGEPLRQFQGVLGGAPQFLGTLEELIPRGDGSRRS